MTLQFLKDNKQPLAYPHIQTDFLSLAEDTGEHVATVINDDNFPFRLETAISQHYDIDVEDMDITLSDIDKELKCTVSVSTEQANYILTLSQTWIY